MTTKCKFVLSFLCIFTYVFGGIKVGSAWAKNYNSGSYGAGVFSTDQTSTCSTESPRGSIKIESISFGVSHMIVRFQGMEEPYNEFEIESGSSANFGADSLGNVTFGNRSTNEYRYENLIPNKKYYFRVRAVHGCAKGDWSNIMSATTLSNGEVSGSEGNNSTKIVLIRTTDSDTKSPESYNLVIKVLTKKGRLIDGAAVTIKELSLVKETNNEGLVEFLNVPKGEYTVEVVAPKIKGVQTINLDRNYVQDFVVTVQEVEPQPPTPKNKMIIGGWVILGTGALYLTFRLIKNRV